MPSPQVSLQVSAVPVLSAAMAHNRIGVLGEIRVCNDGPALPGAGLRVTVQADPEPTDGTPTVLGSVTVPMDLPSRGTILPPVVPAPLDPVAMCRLAAPVAGRIRVDVIADGHEVAEQACPVRLLGTDHWAATPVTLALEMLASHVRPQDPALRVLLETTARRLERTADGNTADGNTARGAAGAAGAIAAIAEAAYLDGPDRVDEQVAALFDAVRSRRIRLLDPDPGWPVEPQRIRSPGAVLDDRAGSALDIALLLAAGLEGLGLHPLVWIGEAGPMLGYWRERRSLPAAAVTDLDGVVNLVDLGLIRCLDAGLVTGVESGFDRAVAACQPRLHGDLSGLLGVLDVRSARRDRIDALPVRKVAPDGTVRIVEYALPDRSPTSRAGGPADGAVAGTGSGRGHVPQATRAPSRRVQPGSAPPPPQVPARIRQWKNALLDLSLRNRLLNYSGRGAVNLAVPPGLLGALEDTVNAGRAVSLLPADQVSEVQARRGIRFGRELTEEHRADLLSSRHAAYTDIASESYRSRMRSLAYRARTIAEETGANHLYLALGTLVWSLDGRDLRSPVVLVPVTLAPRSRHGTYRIELDEAGTSTPNYCLLEKLRQVHGLTVPGLAEPEEDAAGIDLDAAFRALRRALADAGLDHRVEQTADLALLAFAKFRLWKDLDEHWSDLARNPLVDHLITSPTTTFQDPVTEAGDPPDLDALAGRLPVAADASQVEAIHAAAAGQTFVLEGPPGTGKSQTITNLLAHAIAEGRRVLFVAEKRAALDVVTRRLQAIGLAPFCLDLHDKGAKPSVVRAQIRAALELRVAADEQGLAAAAERLRSSAAQLRRYAERLHRPNAAGLSYYSAHTQLLAVGDGAVLPVPHGIVAGTDADPAVVHRSLAAVRQSLATLPDVADPARPRPDHPWGFVDPADPAGTDAAALAAAAMAVDQAVGGELPAPELRAALLAARTPSEIADLARFAAGYAVDLALLDEAVTDHWRAQVAAAGADVAAFAAAPHPGLDVVTPEVFSLPVDGIAAAARKADESSWFGRKKRQLAVLARLAPALRPGVAVPHKRIAELTGRLAGVWKQIVELQVRLASIPGLRPPGGWNPLVPEGLRWLEGRIEWLTWASGAAAVRDRTGRRLADPGPFRLALRHLLESRAVVGLDERDAVGRLAVALRALAELSGGDAPFRAWAGDGLLATWRRTAGGRRAGEPGQPGLRRYLALLTHLRPLRPAGLDAARALLLSGTIPAADAAHAFDAGLAAAALAERGAATGLDGFEPSAHDTAVRQFTQAAEHVREQLASAIPARMLAGRTFDATSDFGQVGELARELVKRRRGLAVRPLLARYGGLVTAVMPCMLVSPDSLARFFPPRPDLFDLVVFDEASQIRVADAIGALGRARAAVVVGDSKQMPPTSVAESTADPVLEGSDPSGGEAAEDLLGVPDEESILSECVQAGVRRRWLSWHYRSQDEELIAFSNRRYYQDRLSTFPSPLSGAADPGVRGHGVSLIRVDGKFLRSRAGALLRTNPVEADAVVAEVRRLFQAEPDQLPSIGVVTFNAPQRTLIESLLRDVDDERITDALDRTDGEGLFVKNLENVQGDERDVILFSTAFSANDRGVLPLNFGPLNQVGGERRLNVAVTRARRQVLVFSSFDPEELRADETTSQGIKDLRAYLEMARAGTGVVIGSSPKAPAPDRHRDEVAAALAARGLTVATDVGLSDFTLDVVIGTPGGDEDPGGDGDPVLAAGPGGDEDPDGDGDPGSDSDPGDGDDAGRAPAGSTPVTARPRVAVLLDGPAWAARRTVGDRDGLPVRVLSGLMGWPAVERIWLPDWLRDREGVLDRLEKAVQAPAVPVAAARPPASGEAASGEATSARPPSGESAAGVAAPGEPAAGETAPGEPAAGETAAGAATASAPTAGRRAVPDPATRADPGARKSAGLPGESPFAPWISGYLGDRDVLDALPGRRAAEQVRRALAACIQAEGPVHVDRLAKLVAGGFDLGRVSAERRAAILDCLPDGAYRDPADPHFAWPDGLDPAGWTGFRRTGQHPDRPLEHVCQREIGNAMIAICVSGAGVAREQLEAETLHVFGFQRRTATQLSLLDAALRRAVAEGRLIDDRGLLRAR